VAHVRAALFGGMFGTVKGKGNKGLQIKTILFGGAVQRKVRTLFINTLIRYRDSIRSRLLLFLVVGSKSAYLEY